VCLAQRAARTEGKSLSALPKSLREICISLVHLHKSPEEIHIPLDDLPISVEEIPISFGDLCISSEETGWLKPRFGWDSGGCIRAVVHF